MLSRIATIWVTPLTEREDEIEKLLEAYGRDAVATLGADELGFRQHDPRWVRSSGVKTLEEIQDVATHSSRYATGA